MEKIDEMVIEDTEGRPIFVEVFCDPVDGNVEVVVTNKNGRMYFDDLEEVYDTFLGKGWRDA